MWNPLKFFIGESAYLGYDAVKDRGRRRPAKRRVYSQDRQLFRHHRDQLIATAQDAQRNFGLVAWMVRKHLDFVAAFRFQARTDNEDFNRELERYVAWWGKPTNCDVRGRHSLRRMIRLAEATRCLGGDVFVQKLTSPKYRGLVQAIEPDLIRNPERYTEIQVRKEFEENRWINGVKVNSVGRAVRYALCKRSEQSVYDFDRYISPSSLFTLGYYERFDQIRGVSPLAPVLNTMADLYEGIDMTWMKVKLAAAFGLFIFRDSNDPLDGTSAKVDANGDGYNESGHEWDAGSGIFNMELSTEDRAEILESKQPANETVSFMSTMMDLVIKALDLPIGFIDESRSNFSGSRAGLILYEKSCEDKRQDIVDLLDGLTSWRVGMAVADGDIAVPAGMQFDDIKWEWVPAGTPWYDPQKEVAGLKNAIGANLDNLERAARSRGTDFYDNVDINAKAMEYAAERGVDVILATNTSDQTVSGKGDDSESSSDSENEEEQETVGVSDED